MGGIAVKRLSVALFACALLLLAACGGPGTSTPTPAPMPPVETPSPTPTPTLAPMPTPTGFRFTRENFPRLDGSTSLVPLGEAIASVLLGESREDVQDLVQFSRTSQSFRMLAYDNVDILVTADPSESVLEEIRGLDLELDMKPIATEALVFVVNAENPVDGLTAEQVRGIYTGRITNWAEVGGEDRAILPFQRNADAGSQTIMLSAVMGDIPMMEPPTAYVIGGMEGLIEAVRSFDGAEGSIGYSVYYYAHDMEMAKDLKILAIDGVQPTAETIRAEDYPFRAPYYVTIRANTPADSPTRVLFDWILSAEGHRLIESQGYVPAAEGQA